MLTLIFYSNYIRDDIHYVLKEKFPNIEYSRHEKGDITKIMLAVKNFKSLQLRVFDHDISYLGFEYNEDVADLDEIKK